MKKINTSKVAVLMLALTLITACFVGGTFAKYTANIEATGSARVAKFVVGSTTDDASFKVFDMSEIYELDNATDFENPDPETSIKLDGDTIIAPGTWGEFEFTVSNDSEVDVTYSVAYSVDYNGTTSTGLEIPLKWSTNGTDWEDDIEDLDVTNEPLDMDAEDTVKVLWKWDFEGNDTNDTTLGEEGTATPTVTISTTFTQLN